MKKKLVMNFEDFKNEYLREELGIDQKKFGRIFCFLDFGNINHWFDKDRRNINNQVLLNSERWTVDLEWLSLLVGRFSVKSYFYYGFDAQKEISLHLIVKARKFFSTVITKPIQWIKHRLDPIKDIENSRPIVEDKNGQFIRIPKCNFDVELSIDTIRLCENYDSICLFSGDNDFLALLRFLREKKNKKIILVHDGHTRTELKNQADLTISAQQIKKYIAIIKKTQRAQSGEGLDIGPVSTGRMPL